PARPRRRVVALAGCRARRRRGERARPGAPRQAPRGRAMTIHLGPPAGGAGAAGDRPHPAAARRPRRGGRRALLAGLLTLLVAAAVAWVGTHRAGADPRVRTVVVTMHHSRFQ